MEELKMNDKEMLRVLRELKDKQGNPVSISTKDIPVKFFRKVIIRQVSRFDPSKNAKHKALARLQAKGYITLDVSDKRHPKIIIN